MIKGIRGKSILMIIIILLAGFGLGVFISHKINRQDTTISSESPLNIEEEMAIALDNLSKEDTRANLFTGVNTGDKVLALTFQGLSDVTTNEEVLRLVNGANQKVDFFIPGILAAENSNFIEKLYNSGHIIGGHTLLNSENINSEELIFDFLQTNLIIEKIINSRPNTLLVNHREITDELLIAAHACGNKMVVRPTVFLNYQSFKNYEDVLNYISSMGRGAIISIKMEGVLSPEEYDKPREVKKPASDKQASLIEDGQEKIEVSPEQGLINLVGWVLKAIEETNHKLVPVGDLNSYGQGRTPTNRADYYNKVNSSKNGTSLAARPVKRENILNKRHFTKSQLDKLRRNNKGKLAKEYRTIYTTEKSLSYTFYGIDNQLVLNGVLESLRKLGIKGTFFVNKRDIINSQSSIQKIAKEGHELGIALLELHDKDFYTSLDTILFAQKEIEKLTGQFASLVRYPYDLKLEDEILEAISSGNCTVTWQDLSIASSKVGIDGSLDQVIDNIFGLGNIVARRGYIIYFRMDYYKDLSLIPKLISNISQERVDTIAYKDGNPNNASAYSIKPLGSIMKGDKVYDYPINKGDMLAEVKDAIYPGQLETYNDQEKFTHIKNRYIGNPDISKPYTLPGFSLEELAEIDTSGRFTNDKLLFLTFDDWASDKSINHLLYVLDKHNIKGNFFIRTNYMQNNPNILRAIAEAGHDVGSHSDEHLPFAIRRDGGDDEDISGIYHPLNQKEIQERREDLAISYSKLQDVVGDIYVDGRPALNTIFRPPTLAMSKGGMEAIFDMGFDYIVSGDFSTHDYEDTDPMDLVDRIINGMILGGGNKRKIQNGSILVMHMADFEHGSIHDKNLTAEALDIAIPILKDKGYSFARLSDYLK